MPLNLSGATFVTPPSGKCPNFPLQSMLEVPLVGSGVKFAPPPLGKFPNMTWRRGHNMLLCEDKVGSKVEVLMFLGVFVVLTLPLLYVYGVLNVY